MKKETLEPTFEVNDASKFRELQFMSKNKQT